MLENVLALGLGFEPVTKESLLGTDILGSVPQSGCTHTVCAFPCQALSMAAVSSGASFPVLLVRLSRYLQRLLC